jgi:hypothetical protein
MTQEELPQPKPDGERWLELIGYGHLKGQPTGYAIDGQPVPAEQFDRLCGEHARPIFLALEQLGPSHPRYEQFMAVARKAFQGYFDSVEPSQ